jgi:hypothetical protein
MSLTLPAPRPPRLLALGLLLAAALPAAGCKRLATGARETFARDYSCPEDRVEVIERADIGYSSLFEPPPPGTPAPEVAADPERLAKWKSDQEEARATLTRNFDRSMTVYQVTGCDHEVLMGCQHRTDYDGAKDLSRVNCFTPEGGKKR